MSVIEYRKRSDKKEQQEGKVTIPYRKNKTMFMLGKSCAVDAFWGNKEVKKEIQDIAEARPHKFTIEAAADIFMLGYIHGKRAERARRKRGSSNGKTETDRSGSNGI